MSKAIWESILSNAFINFWESIPLSERINPGRPTQDIAAMGWKGAMIGVAAMLEGAGCICALGSAYGRFGAYPIGRRGLREWRLDEHDPRCPVALAEALRKAAA